MTEGEELFNVDLNYAYGHGEAELFKHSWMYFSDEADDFVFDYDVSNASFYEAWMSRFFNGEF